MSEVKTGAEIHKMLEVNQAQAEFYNKPQKNLATKIWTWGRGKLLRSIRMDIGVSDEVYRLHKAWIGDLTGKRVLDLGVFGGNALSLDIAKRSAYYLGIDLSERGINQLKQKISEAGISHAHAVVIDFLSDEFDQYGKFDLVYVYGAMHHFEHFEVLLQKISDILTEDGKIVTYDPTETSPIVSAIRAMYRPFQSDAAWEWPFTRKTYETIQQYFDVQHVQGFLGKSKKSVLLAALPISRKTKSKWSKKWHAYDLEHANKFGNALYACMHVAMCLKNRKSVDF